MKRMHWFLVGALSVLGACGPSEKTQAERAEKKRVECLDKRCEGDVEPERDMNTEVAIKLNGKWYVGPKTYFNNYDGRAGFEWWDHKPISRDMKRPPELQALVVDGKGYDVVIEIFLSTPMVNPAGKTLYQTLMEMESRGLVLEKSTPRSGLQVWRTREQGFLLETWYVATSLKEPSGDPPTIACRESVPKHARCNTGFRWQPDVAVSMRFRASHGPDWPEIYQEADRVLKLLRKV